jgi:GntR family transcriptional repressor for pyruvate dehydrogenase complex
MDPGVETVAADNQVAMQVVRHIRGLIETGELRRGERLPPEREFAKELKISRASLRAGVGYLAAMGVLKVRHGVGNFVADGPPALGTASFEMMYSLHGFTPHQMFEARLLLEGSLVAMAAERGSEAHFTALGEEVTDMYATMADPQAYLIHDVRFHRIIGEASGNPILGALMETISASFYDTRRVTVERTRDLKATTEMHREIYQAVRQRKPAEARQLMERHLHAAEEAFASEAAAG